MSFVTLVRHWRGRTLELIAQDYEDPTTVKEVDEIISRERKRIEDAALRNIVKRAKDGDVAAVDWLESRGCINLLHR